MKNLIDAASCTAVLIGMSALVQAALAQANGPAQAPQAPMANTAATSGALTAIPANPKGKSTILGGEILHIDPVRDEMTLKIYGQHPVKILFDERTQFFRDGKRLPLLQMKPADHASVQTLLDGTSVFALSVHVLSKTPQGEYQGLVLSFDQGTGQLSMSSVLFHQPIKLMVPPGTPMVRVGQSGFTSQQSTVTDLMRGSLISVEFGSDKSGHGVASHISVLATPGSAFVFVGSVDSLDMHAGVMSVLDTQDSKTYQVSFDPATLPKTQTLHPGDNVMVTAAFRGDHYVASAITINQ